MRIHLVRHGRPLVDRGLPASAWELDPAGYDDVWALRTSGRLPRSATWLSSPEPKALGTAHLLTDGEVGVVEDLREHERGAGWVDDLAGAVERAFARPDVPAAPGWEPLEDCRRRVLAALDGVRAAHAGDDEVVLVGHGTAWTLAAAALTDSAPDLDRWRSLALPDLWSIDRPS